MRKSCRNLLTMIFACVAAWNSVGHCAEPEPVPAASGKSPVNGPIGTLTYSIRMSKPVYLTGERITVTSTLTNNGLTPVLLLKPAVVYSQYYWLDEVELVRGLIARISAAIPGANDLVQLGAGQSVELEYNLAALAPAIAPGKHRLAAGYTTKRFPLKGVWQGEIKTGELEFTVEEPQGIELDAYTRYREIERLCLITRPTEDGGKVGEVADRFIEDFPTSAYVPAIIEMVIPVFRNAKADLATIALIERYLKLRRGDGKGFLKHVGEQLALAHHQYGHSERAQDVLKQYAGGPDNPLWWKFEAAIHRKAPDDLGKPNAIGKINEAK